jgi:histidine triad (HIT) family protein
MATTRAINWKNDDWFCHGILDGALAADRLYENEYAVAFVAPQGHRNKKYDVHALVIPKAHVETLLDFGGDSALAGGIIDAITAAAHALDLDEDGFLVRANVLPPYQGTGHAHFHLLSGKRKKKKRA